MGGLAVDGGGETGGVVQAAWWVKGSLAALLVLSSAQKTISHVLPKSTESTL